MLTWKFCTKQEATEHLCQTDNYLEKLNDFNLTTFIKTDSLDTYLTKVIPEACADWSEAQGKLFEKALQNVSTKLIEAGIFLDQEIKLILTNGTEMSELEYTRGNAIIFPYAKFSKKEHFFQTKFVSDLYGPSETLIAHELFHILSRQNPEMRRKVYQSFGFKEMPEDFLPIAFENQIINPDAVEHKWMCKVILRLTDEQVKENKKRKKKNLPPIVGDSLWGFPLICESNWKSFMVVDESTLEAISTIPVSKTDLADRINPKITSYLSHAEEIAAEYFKHIICHPDNLKFAELKIFNSVVTEYFAQDLSKNNKPSK